MNYTQVHQNWQFWYGPTTYTPSPRTPKELADTWRRLPFFCKSTGSLLSSRGALGVFLPKGHAEHVPPVGWKLVQQLDALGHRLDSSADSKPCMMRTISMAWAAFWKNYNMVSRALGLSRPDADSSSGLSRLWSGSAARVGSGKFRLPRRSSSSKAECLAP
jgi:hypothetical protein